MAGAKSVTRLRQYAAVTVAAAIGGLFVYAGLAKIVTGPDATQLALLVVGFENPTVIRTVATGLPWFELALGVWVAIGVSRRASTYCALIVVTLFLSVTVLLGLSSGWNSPCACLGDFDEEPAYIALARNVVLMCACVLLLQINGPRDGNWYLPESTSGLASTREL